MNAEKPDRIALSSDDNDPRKCENYRLKLSAHELAMKSDANKGIALKDGCPNFISQANNFSEDSKRLLCNVMQICNSTRCEIQTECTECVSEDTSPLREELLAKFKNTPSSMSIDTTMALAKIAALDILNQPQEGALSRFVKFIKRKRTETREGK